MIENNTSIQLMLDNILDNVNIIQNDFNRNGKTHYNYVLEKLKRAKIDLDILVEYAEDMKKKDSDTNVKD